VEIIISSVAGLVVGAVATKLITGVASSAGTVLGGAAKRSDQGRAGNTGSRVWHVVRRG